MSAYLRLLGTLGFKKANVIYIHLSGCNFAMSMLKSLKDLKLGAKLNLVMFSMLVALVLVSGAMLSWVLERNAEGVVADQALALIETMSSVREYTSQEVRPELAEKLETEPTFLAQTVPGYSARQVFEYLRQRDAGYRDFYYKEATLNPTNPRDQADAFEAELVNAFRRGEEVSELRGFRQLNGEALYYVARPLEVSKESCLACHSTPEVAPASLIATYGDRGGFGWELNEIVGAQILSVPAGEVLGRAFSLQWRVIGILVALFVLATLVLHVLLKRAIIQPLTSMAQQSRQVSTGDLTGEFTHDSKDEIGMLASSLNRMKVSMQMALEMLEKSN